MGNMQMRHASSSSTSSTSPTSPFSQETRVERGPRNGRRRNGLRWNRRHVAGDPRHSTRLEASWIQPPVALEIPSPCTCVEWHTDFDECFEARKDLGANVAVRRDTGAVVATEFYDRCRGSVSEAEKFRSLDCELSVHQSVEESSVAKRIEGCYLKRESYIVVTEPCSGRTLREELQETGPMTESQVAAVLHCVMEILRLCIEKRIVHGNITPGAFRLRTRKDDPFRIPGLCFAPSGWLKTTDFRHSRYIFHGDRLGNPRDSWDLPTGGRYSDRFPRPLYIAPEIFEQSYAYESDMWSLGVMGYELLSGRLPFWESTREAVRLSDSAIRQTILAVEPDLDIPRFREASSTCLDFFYRVLDKNPYSRMSIYEAMTHPWIQRRIKKDTVPNLGEGYLINPKLS